MDGIPEGGEGTSAVFCEAEPTNERAHRVVAAQR